MDTLEREATDAGKQRGWEHANFVDAYGGTMEPEESEIEVPSRYLQVPTYYTAGFSEGVQEYIEENREDDEYRDPREDEWNGLV